MERRIPFVLFSVALLVALAATVAHATPCNVPAYPTIRAAVADPTCDTVNIAPGTYFENEITITRDVTLNGDNQATTIIDGSSGDRIMRIDNTVTIKGVTLQNGFQPDFDGGAILNI